MAKDANELSREELLAENTLLREEIKAAHQAIELNKQLALDEFSKVEKLLTRLHEKATTEQELRKQLEEELTRSQKRERQLAEARQTAEIAKQQTLTALQETEVLLKRLEMVASLSERLNAILDVDQLLVELVTLVKERFNYYHVHVYTLDASGKNLIIRAGYGQSGAKMKAQDHTIPLQAETSLVARAARTAKIAWMDNVREASDWLPDPLLPDTYAEMAVPIILEEQTIGVLDVQQDKIAGLDEGDTSMLRTLANQVAIAVRNARLFEKVEIALAEAQAVQEQYVTQNWQKTNLAPQNRERLYVHPNAPELSEATLDETKRQALAQERPTIVSIDDYEGSPKSLVAPIRLSGKTIGALQLHKMYLEDNGQSWTEQDLEFVEAVLDQVGLTAENLRLFDETREQAGRERLIGEITRKLRQAPTLEALVKTAGEELGQALGVSHSVVKVGVAPTSENR